MVETLSTIFYHPFHKLVERTPHQPPTNQMVNHPPNDPRTPHLNPPPTPHLGGAAGGGWGAEG